MALTEYQKAAYAAYGISGDPWENFNPQKGLTPDLKKLLDGESARGDGFSKIISPDGSWNISRYMNAPVGDNPATYQYDVTSSVGALGDKMIGGFDQSGNFTGLRRATGGNHLMNALIPLAAGLGMYFGPGLMGAGAAESSGGAAIGGAGDAVLAGGAELDALASGAIGASEPVMTGLGTIDLGNGMVLNAGSGSGFFADVAPGAAFGTGGVGEFQSMVNGAPGGSAPVPGAGAGGSGGPAAAPAKGIAEQLGINKLVDKLGAQALAAGASSLLGPLMSPDMPTPPSIANDSPAPVKPIDAVTKAAFEMPDPLSQTRAKKRSIIEQMGRRGRASTVLTKSGKLGG